MNANRLGSLLGACLTAGVALAGMGQTAPGRTAQGTILAQACDFQGRLRGEESFIVVPENRAEPASRLITVHYFRFPAREPSGLPPVFVLPGGPGDSIVAADIQNGLRQKGYSLVAEIEAYHRRRDVVIVNQRGNPAVPGVHRLPPAWEAAPGQVSEPMSFSAAAERLAAGFKSAIRKCEALNFDLRGYDILHLADDVEAIRAAHGYEKIALRGSSFGSQWALAYLQRQPARVDRMILAGIEPLDHAYDSAEGIWNVFQRIEDEVRATGAIALPEVGLLGALKAVITRLEKRPVRVRGQHPRRGYAAEVTIGPDDFRHYLMRPILDAPAHSRRTLELWPKLVLEIYHEDYQYLAAKIIDDRPETVRGGLLLTLVDSSLGITAARRLNLAQEAAYRWLGDVNWMHTAIRHVTPVREVSDAFRQMVSSNLPVLMIHGTLDLATPLENAHTLLKHFPHGRLITVNGGTHAATHHAASVDPEFLARLTGFMNTDDPAAALEKMPAEISLPALRIQGLGGKTLFEEWRQPVGGDGARKE